MTNEWICYDCLTDDNVKVSAVTMLNGRAICEKCAREWAEHQEQMRLQIPTEPPTITFGQ